MVQAQTTEPNNQYRAYILGMDTFALGLIKAAKLIEDGRIDDFIAQRYASYNSGIGAKIRADETSLEELAAYAEEMGAPALPGILCHGGITGFG